MKINDVAKFTGITIRTLHYYDEIGLLKPSRVTESGYRIYDKKDLEILQQILFFKELDFKLNDIKYIITRPDFDKKKSLKKHKELLIKRRERLDKLIKLADDAIKGEKDMSFKEFDTTEIENIKKKYEKEVKERWGKTDAYKESNEKTESYSKGDWKMINTECESILKEFSENTDKAPESSEVQMLVKKWQDFICSNFYNCTKEILKSLSEMYVYDERFKKNINKNGKGIAEFMAKAIKIYCEKQ